MPDQPQSVQRALAAPPDQEGRPSVGDAQLAALGSSTAARLLGKADDPNLNFDPVSPNVRTFDVDDDLAKAGAATARALKAEGYLNPISSRVMA
jgi:hypothetical protein